MNNSDQYGSRISSTTGQNQNTKTLTKLGNNDPQSTSQKLKNTNMPSITNKNQTNNTTKGITTGKSDQQEIYVKKWVDYSTKYGLGYLLSNGSSGVFFNDCTKVI